MTGEDGEVLRENIARALFNDDLNWKRFPEHMREQLREPADRVLALIAPVMEENERLLRERDNAVSNCKAAVEWLIELGVDPSAFEARAAE